MRIFIVVLLLLVSGAVGAEQPVAVPDRVVASFAVAHVPIQRAVGRLASSEGLCMATELYRKNLTKEELAHPTAKPENRPNVSISAQPRTLQATLDTMVSQAPSFAYQIHGEWINLGRRDDMSDPDNPLNWRIPGSITLSTETAKDGDPPEVRAWIREMKLHFVLHGSLMAFRQSKPVEPQTVVLDNPTLREYMNCLTQLRGKTTWTVIVEPNLTKPGFMMWIEGYGVLAGDTLHLPAE